MFALYCIELNNFRSYRGEHKFNFPDKDGLYYLQGQNLSDDRLASNGAGKSTLWEAVTWVLYGRTSRGLKANEVITWGEATCKVTLELTVGPDRYVVARSQKPNNLTIDAKPVDQTELEKHIRLNFEAFTSAVLNAQFGTSFFALQPSAKLTLFSDIMKLDFWLEKSKTAEKAAKALETDITGHTTVIDQHEGKIELVEADIDDLEAKEASFKNEREQQVAVIKAESLQAWKDVRKCADYEEEYPILKKELKDGLQKALNERVRFDSMIEHLLYGLSENAKEKAVAIDRHEAAISATKIMNSQQGMCPRCNQPMTTEHKNKQIKHLARELRLSEETINAYSKTHENLMADVVRIKQWAKTNDSTIDDLKDELRKLEDKKAKALAKADAAQVRFDDLGKRLHRIEAEGNPHTEMLARKRTQLKEYRKIIAESTKTLNELEAEHVAVSFWIKGFKRVRLFIIEQAFRTLEIEINNSLAQLGMVNWQITFDIERENKSGGVTKGFVVFVKGPSNPEPVRWENWSGGETQRLQLAGDLGLSNLIMQQAGLTNTIEVFDEPSTHLSVEGMADLANLLHDRAVNDGKRIWIIDHTSITNFGEFEGVIKVRKDINGSRIIGG